MRTGSRVRRVIDPPIVAFKDTLRDLLARGDVIDLSQAVPGYPPPPPVADALISAAGDPAASRYTPDPGLPECRDAIAGYLARRHGAGIDWGRVLVTPGANAAFHFVANALLDPGERAWLLSPWYFNHAMSVELLGGVVEEIRLPAELSVGRAVAAGGLDAVPPGGILIVVNPSNPTGRRFDLADLRALLAWAGERGTRLVFDETYLEFHPPAETPATALAVEGWERSAVVVGTFSKSLAVTGHRVGYLCAGADTLREVLKVQDTAAVCAPHPGQLAVTAALRWHGLDAWLEARRRETHERVVAFTDELARTPGPFTVELAGAFFAWVRHGAELRDRFGSAGDPRGRPVPPALPVPPSWPVPPEWQVADRLAREHGVVALPGASFGPGERDRLRVAVGNADPGALREAARRMQAFDPR